MTEPERVMGTSQLVNCSWSRSAVAWVPLNLQLVSGREGAVGEGCAMNSKEVWTQLQAGGTAVTCTLLLTASSRLTVISEL